MSLELKNIKYSAFASQETHCYQAYLYFKGKKVASVGNDGHGGCDHQHFTSKEAEKAVHEWLWGMGGYWPHNCDKYGEATALEFWCCYRVNDFLQQKDLKKLLSKRVVYTIKGEEGIWQTQAAPRAAVRDKWIEEVLERPDTDQVLNKLSLGEAIALYKGAS